MFSKFTVAPVFYNSDVLASSGSAHAVKPGTRHCINSVDGPELSLSVTR